MSARLVIGVAANSQNHIGGVPQMTDIGHAFDLIPGQREGPLRVEIEGQDTFGLDWGFGCGNAGPGRRNGRISP
jgi:hypothetical protein